VNISDLELLRILESAIFRKVVRFALRRSDYESSFELQDLDITLDDGTVLELIIKDTGRSAMLPAAIDSKQETSFNPKRELQMYRSILSPERHGTARHYSLEIDSAPFRHWLILERVAGMKLCFIGEFADWLDAARWLARFHSEWENQVETVSDKVPVIVYDREHYQRWCNRAVDLVARAAPDSSSAMLRVAEQYEMVIDRLLSVPSTLCHGDYYPANILVREGESRRRICPVDWELACSAPGLIDLASLIAGQWSDSERRELIRAYALEAGVPVVESLEENLNYCRLHLAVQWLGWSPKWAPPVDQANDWLAEMISLATLLKLL
jgi:hypothetical protein